MLDVLGTSLTAEDTEILQHPLVGGLILFTRNYHSPEQVSELTFNIRKAAKKDIIIAVDHEGGRVQRFRDGFSLIPAMGKIWQASKKDMTLAKSLAKQAAILMALEVQAVGIDISFAPVLDINDISEVIGDRAFHQHPEYVYQLASSFIEGMNQVGMQATGKHFPGHGSVQADSHIALPVDTRSKSAIFNKDLLPFKQLIAECKLGAIMPAHVIFPEVDENAVGFSHFWLQTVLRQEFGFEGVIFSDDLSMKGASCVGGYVERVEAAQSAGCDMLLVCNDRAGVIEVLDNANVSINEVSGERIKRLLNKPNMQSSLNWQSLSHQPLWSNAKQALRCFN